MMKVVCVVGNSAPGPSPAFLAALTSLSEHADHMLLPQSLHQVGLINWKLLSFCSHEHKNGRYTDCPITNNVFLN